MEAVIEFLTEYGVWVLIILVILLITVIGFLADTKKKKKMRESVNNNENNNSGEMNMNQGFNNMDPMNQNPNMFMNQNFGVPTQAANMNNNFQPNMGQNINMPNQGMDMMQNNMPNPNAEILNNNLMNNNILGENEVVPNMANSINQNASVNPTFDNNVNAINTPQTNEGFFSPLSEQKPQIPPREVVIPTPVEPTPIMNQTEPVGAPINNWNNVNVVPEVAPVNQANNIPTTPNNGMNIEPQQNVINNIPNSIPSPVTPVTPTPEVPSNPMPMGGVNNQIQQQMPNTQTTPDFTNQNIPNMMPNNLNNVNPGMIPNMNQNPNINNQMPNNWNQ